MRIDPDSRDAYANLGNAYAIQNLNDEAIEAYRRALRLDPKDANTHFNLGQTYAKVGRDSEARIQVEILEGLDPLRADELRRRLRLGPGPS